MRKTLITRINKRTVLQAVKISIAAILAIILANLLALDYAISAGVIAILTIQPTKRETIVTAVGRLYAFMIALVLAYGSFFVFGYGNIGFFVYLFLFVGVCWIFRWQNAMAMCSVLISHFVSYKSMTASHIFNEMLIFCIGVGIGIIANLHLRKKADYMEQLKEEADKQIVTILERMAERIINQDISDYNGDCFERLNMQIAEAKMVAEENYQNQIRKADVFDGEYIAMRERQSHILYEMYKNIRTITSTVETAKRISDFLRHMALVYDKENDGKALMQMFKEMHGDMKQYPLPTSREEFENRAHLFALMCNLEELIQIKIDFIKIYE